MASEIYLRQAIRRPEVGRAVTKAIWAGCRTPDYVSIRNSLQRSLGVEPDSVLVSACNEVAQLALYGMLYDAQLSQGLAGTKFDFLLRNP